MRRFLVSARITRNAPARYGDWSIVNTVITLDADESMNALAVSQIQELFCTEHHAETATVISIHPLEGAVPTGSDPAASQLLEDWMVANEYCTVNEIEGSGNTIAGLVHDHVLVKTERDHLKGLAQKAQCYLVNIRESQDLGYSQHAAGELFVTFKNVLRHLEETRADKPLSASPRGCVQDQASRSASPLPPSPFRVGQSVRKVTGEYNIAGIVRSIFTKSDGGVRLVVEHTAEGGGSFLHIYGEANLAAEPEQ